MKSITTILILTSSLFGVSEDYKKTQSEIKDAIEEGNFLEVKELLQNIIPLMRDNIKEQKINYNKAKKTGEKTEISNLKEVLKRKIEIYDNLNHLLEVSPAAVRVRSDTIERLLEEFNDLSKSSY